MKGKGQFKVHSYSPKVKPTFAAPPTPAMIRTAIKVVKRNAPSEAQLRQDLEMLGLDRLVGI